MSIETAEPRDSEPFPDYYNDLPACLHHAWLLLGRATQDRKSAFHAPVVATHSADGPQARVLVLRAVDKAKKNLTFHTDTRSEKIAELAADSRVAVTFYDAAKKLQLRINGRATLHGADALADARWQAARPSSLRCYLGAQPGAVSPQPSSGLPSALEGREPLEGELQAGRAHFAVLQVAIERIDWLYLHSLGQRRARFVWQGEECAMQWVNP
jgi:pyridoxamine 5'-phosphate oxidase